MLGWEFPPYSVGGLGVACHGLAKGLIKNGNTVKVVLPKAPPSTNKNLKLIGTHNIDIPDSFAYSAKFLKQINVDSYLAPYMDAKEYTTVLQKESQTKTFIKGEKGEPEISTDALYGKNIYSEVYRYANKIGTIAKTESFEVIHAHDWMTFPGGIIAKKISGKPLVIHIHNTAFDRSGGNPNPKEYDIEYEGFHAADKVIAISNFVKNTLVSKYALPPSKIAVVHNGIDSETYTYKPTVSKMSQKDKIVLFAGRVTIQKGPDYFVKAAKKICEKRDDVKFVLAGPGDMLDRMINMSAELGISDKFIFTGKYTKEEGERLMSMADVFVMPSISEPFGLVPFEAMIQKTPTVISKQSGVSEVLANTLKVDFWDINQLASKIMAVLDYPALHQQISEYGEQEVKIHSWDKAASKCVGVFNSVILEKNKSGKLTDFSGGTRKW
jgi:glycogen(starch) synthase